MSMDIKTIIEQLRSFSTPELCDGATVLRSMDSSICHRVGASMIAGPALTVDVPDGEGALVAEAILQANSGDILVVGGHGNCSVSYWGDHRSICAKLKGLEGIVIDGAFRDIEGCREAGFPVFAKGITCATAAKKGTGTLGTQVVCGGITVQTGDIVVADLNGVVVIKPEEAADVMNRALKKRELQDAVIAYMKRTGNIITSLKGLTKERVETWK